MKQEAMKRVLRMSLIVVAGLLLVGAVQGVAEESVVVATVPGSAACSATAADPSAVAARALVESLYDNRGLFVAARAIQPCLDSGVSCPGDRWCLQNVCGTWGNACQCNPSSFGNTCQICF